MRKKILALAILCVIAIGHIFGQCTATITGPTGTVCTGDMVTLTASVGGATPGACTQSVNIANTTTTVQCGSSICFYDSGGPSGNYGVSENYVHTFTSSNNSPVTITFLSANGESCCDYITVYNGAGTGGTQLHYGLLSTVNGNATFTSTGGSITVKFTSDGSVCYNGWEAIVSCDACSDYTYTWSTGEHTPTITVAPTTSTTYTCTVESGDCCNSVATYTINPTNCVNNCNGFEDVADRAEWTLVNGTQTNQWVMNTGVNNGGQYSLYISDSPTSSVPAHSYNTSSTSNVWAYKEFEFPECDEDFVLSFDWINYGESCCDYIQVFLGEFAAVTAGSSTPPAGATQLNATNLNMQGSWQHLEYILPAADYGGQILTLYFLWHNDGSVGTMPPGGIDNVCLQACVPCDQPVVTVTPASAILCQGASATFTASATGGSGTGYTFEWSPANTLDVSTGPTVTASPQETTTYRVRVEDSEGCAKTVRVTAEVSGTRVNVEANPAGFCIGQNQTVTVTATLHAEGSCNAYSYAWSTGAVGTSITVNPDVTTEYTVTATPADPACCEIIANTTVAVMDCSADGCPSVTPAELGTNNPEITLDCATQQEVTLCANVLATAVEADDYFVFQIPYAPPFGYTDGNRIFANASDDTWSEVVHLPFTFCYYGNTYTDVVAGANSVATFNTAVANSRCEYSFNESIPDAALFPNTIFACYRDIHPSTSDYVASTGTGGIFEGVLGEYPCRCYKLSFNNIKLYSCTSVTTFSSMIVLYEGTNIIDIYLRDAPTCMDWNHGNGVIGLQNSDCSRGITPPGRNTGPWTAHEEAWRFMPTGQPSYDVTWYQGTDTSAATGVVLGHGDLLTVAPEETTFYTARLQYTACNGDEFDLINTCHVTVNNERPPLRVTASKDTLCPDEEVTIQATSEGAVSYTWNTGDTVSHFTLVPDSVVTTYVCTTLYENGCTRTDSVTVYAVATIDPPTFVLEPAEICAGERSTITCENEYATYRWSNGGNTQSITVMPQTTTNYALTVADEVGCSASAETQIIVHPKPTAAFAPEQYLNFLEEGVADVQFIDFSENAAGWLYDFGDQWSNSNQVTDQNPTHTYTHSGIYTVTQWVTSDFGCADSTTHLVSIQKPYYFYIPNSFTPDGDGINEIWVPLGEGVDESNYVCMIYDRNGRLIFQTNNLRQGWDGTCNGKPVPLGAYVYVIQTSSMDAEPKEYIGTVTVIR